MTESNTRTHADTVFHLPLYERLQPRTEWRGGRMADTDLLPLEDAARMASKHAGEEVTPADFLRAAGRGEIRLHAFVHRAAKVQAHDGGVLFNKGAANENIVRAGNIAPLPLTACLHLANVGRASWRTFDGFEEIDGQWMRYTKGMLTDDEPDFETAPADCRVTGNDVHALADAFLPEEPEAQSQAAASAPVMADSESMARAWTVTKPQRYHGYTAPLYRLIAAAHREGKSCPTARDVVEAWRTDKPSEIAKVLPDGFDYYDAKGDTKPADLDAVRRAIGRMTTAR